jgi:hypothetical protein
MRKMRRAEQKSADQDFSSFSGFGVIGKGIVAKYNHVFCPTAASLTFTSKHWWKYVRRHQDFGKERAQDSSDEFYKIYLEFEKLLSHPLNDIANYQPGSSWIHGIRLYSMFGFLNVLLFNRHGLRGRCRLQPHIRLAHRIPIVPDHLPLPGAIALRRGLHPAPATAHD